MNEAQILDRTGRLLFGVPMLAVGLGIVAGILSLFYLREENVGYALGTIACVVVIFVVVHYALGMAAKLLGSSWVLFGVLPVLFVPFGQLASWAILLDKRLKLKKRVEQGAARA